MDLRDYLQLLAKRWPLVASVLLACLAAAMGIMFAMPRTYQAQTQLFVSVQGGAGDVNALSEGGSFAQQRVQSYAQLASSPRITAPVVKKLGLGLTPQQLADRVSASAPPDTVLINIQATGGSPQQAASIANAVGGRLAKVVEKLEAPSPTSGSLVRVNAVYEASLPAAPESPRPPLNLALGLLAGLALGMGAAVLRETLDTSVKTSADLAQTTDLPVLGTITRNVSHDRRMEAFRQLRTNLQFKEVDRKPRTITVTSAVREEGKSTVAGNLAVALAQVGQRVCLVDSDLRNPHIANYMGLVGEAGLTNVLIGQASVGEVVQRAGTRLDVLASGPVPPNPSELLASQRMQQLMRDLLGRYDMVIVDTPPLLPVTDGAVLTCQADGALLVVRAGKTPRAQAVQAVEALRNVGARLLGAVLNMVPATGGDSPTYGYGHLPEATQPEEGGGAREPTDPGEAQHPTSSAGQRPSATGNGHPPSAPEPDAQNPAATVEPRRHGTTEENGTQP